MTKMVECNEHGKCEGCMICQHLFQKKGLGYAKVLVEPGDDDYETAMCEECEAMLLKENAWSEKLYEFADWQLICRECYEITLTHHKLIAEGGMK